MAGASQREESGRDQEKIVLPYRTLVVLCGPAGAGKSTFARELVERHRRQGFKATAIVSSDHCRALVCDDETNQQANRDTFDLFHYIIHKRMFQHRLTLADSTALTQEARKRLHELAERHRYHTCVLIFNVARETCIEHDKHQTRGRTVGEQVIDYHYGLLAQALLDIPREGWNQVYILNEQNMNINVEFLSS